MSPKEVFVINYRVVCKCIAVSSGTVTVANVGNTSSEILFMIVRFLVGKHALVLGCINISWETASRVCRMCRLTFAFFAVPVFVSSISIPRQRFFA